MKDLNFHISVLSKLLNNREITAEELVRECLRRIESKDAASDFAYLDPNGAIQAARLSDNRREKGESQGILEGIPFAAEDRFCTLDLPTGNNCALLRGYRSPYEADAVRSLRDAGAILLGKLRTDGFLSGNIKNDQKIRTSALAVGETLPFAVCADTGGSLLRQSTRDTVHGTVLWKAAGSGISRYGMIPCAPSFDSVVFMAHTAEDAAVVYRALANQTDESEVSTSSRGCKLSHVGILSEDSALITSRKKLTAAGTVAETASVSFPQAVLKAYRILSSVETASEMALYDGIRFGACAQEGGNAETRTAETRGRYFSYDEKKILLLGTALLMDGRRENGYRAAREIKWEIERSLKTLFGAYDVILCPLTAETSVLSSFGNLSAITLDGVLLMTVLGREELLLRCAEILTEPRGGSRYE